MRHLKNPWAGENVVHYSIWLQGIFVLYW